LWRWFHEDAIRPWYHRSWIFPRDPDFAAKAGRVLDLYARQWQGRALKDDEFVISADEKTSIQARRRKHATQACRPRTPIHVEHEYFRCGSWTYIVDLDVHHARIFGRRESKNGILPFDRLVEQVMTQPPYNDARRVFWIVDNCSVHRAPELLSACELSIRASCLCMPRFMPVGLTRSIYFSIVQRKVLTPNDFTDLNTLAERLLDFQYYWETMARPFESKFTRQDLAQLLDKLATPRYAKNTLVNF
jgi:hypothetical protein